MLKEKEYDSMKSALMKKADEMGNLSGIIKECKRKLETIETQKKEIQNEFIVDVSLEMENPPEGLTSAVPKPKFTNEYTRKAELGKRLKESERYDEILMIEEGEKIGLLDAEIKLGMAEKKYDAFKAVAEMMVAEMNLKADLHRDFDRE
jgi:hypothetical protein